MAWPRRRFVAPSVCIRLAATASGAEIRTCQAKELEETSDEVAHVQFPPAQAVAGRGRKRAVAVVPAFAHAQHAEHQVVPAVIAAMKPAPAS